jgi:hypothetical protein
MMKLARTALIAAAGLLVALPAGAAQYVYPLQGQDAAKQSSDEADCSSWAANQEGLDREAGASFLPDAAATGTAGDAVASVPSLGALPGNGLQGGAAGALGGGGPGEVGSATNALVNNAGGVAGREGAAGGAAAPGSAPSGFDTARAACLTARGYSVH